MKVTANGDMCAGAGNCVYVAPEVFDQDDDGIVILLNENPPDDQRAAVQEAVDLCPVSALTVSD